MAPIIALGAQFTTRFVFVQMFHRNNIAKTILILTYGSKPHNRDYRRKVT